MLIENKLKEFLEFHKKNIETQIKDKESVSKLSYYYGMLHEIDYILNWINDIPSYEIVNKVIKSIEETHSEESNYRYCGFNYQELLKLKQIYELQE
jgi:hypothetical protein